MTALVLQDSISQQSKHKKGYNTIVTQYGDGYIQRASDGINTQKEMWDILYDNLTNAELATLQSFFDTVEMFGVIEWAPPGESEKKWIIDPEKEIQFTVKAGDVNDVRFSLKRVYDLG